MTATATPLNDFDAFKRAYPRVFAELAREGYSNSGEPAIVGRCVGDFSLYIELCEKTDVVRAWIWDAIRFEFVGPACEVTGPKDKAVERARRYLETLYSEDQVSGTLPRYPNQVVEALHVDQ